MKRRIVTVYPDWDKVGGAQNVAIQLAKSLNENKSSLIICQTPIKQIEKAYTSENVIFQKHSISIFRLLLDEDIILSHHRKMTTLYILLKNIFKKKFVIIHVAHNTFTNLKWGTLFPKYVIAVSNGVKQNLIDYFGLSEDRITVIFNGILDQYNHDTSLIIKHRDTIKILFAGRICPVKRQVKFVQNLQGKLNSNIEIFFAGVGEDLDLLKQTIRNDSHFHVLGQIDINSHMPEYDYVCLFSEKEGLPIILIEACMFGKPLLTNGILAVLDVNHHGKNGFVFRTWDELLKGINNLSTLSMDEYKRLSENSRNYYLNHFSQERMISEYKKLINTIIL